MKHLLRPDSLKDSVVTNEVGTGEPTPGSTGWPKDKDGIFGTSKAGVRWSSTWSRYELEQTYTEKYEREKYEVWKREVWSMKRKVWSMKYRHKLLPGTLGAMSTLLHPCQEKRGSPDRGICRIPHSSSSRFALGWCCCCPQSRGNLPCQL